MTPTPPIRNIPAPTITPMRNNPNLFLTRVSNVDTSTSARSPRIWLRALVSDRSPETATVRTRAPTCQWDRRCARGQRASTRTRVPTCRHGCQRPFTASPAAPQRRRGVLLDLRRGRRAAVAALQRLRVLHPPARARCARRCLSRDLAPQEVSGRGHVETFTVNYQQWIPGSDPYVIAWVSIDEQPDVRLTTNLVDVEPEDVHVGMPVRVRLRARRRRLAPALHARPTRRTAVVSPGPVEEPLERRAVISGIGQSAVGRRLGRSRPRPDRGGGAGGHRRRRPHPRRHRRALDVSRHGGRDARVRRSAVARGPGRPGPVARTGTTAAARDRPRCAP